MTNNKVDLLNVCRFHNVVFSIMILFVLFFFFNFRWIRRGLKLRAWRRWRYLFYASLWEFRFGKWMHGRCHGNSKHFYFFRVSKYHHVKSRPSINWWFNWIFFRRFPTKTDYDVLEAIEKVPLSTDKYPNICLWRHILKIQSKDAAADHHNHSYSDLPYKKLSQIDIVKSSPCKL